MAHSSNYYTTKKGARLLNSPHYFVTIHSQCHLDKEFKKTLATSALCSAAVKRLSRHVRPARARSLVGGTPTWKGANHTANSESWVGYGNIDLLSVDSKAIGSDGTSPEIKDGSVCRRCMSVGRQHSMRRIGEPYAGTAGS